MVYGFGEPMDGKGPLALGPIAYPLKAQPPSPTARGRMGGKLNLGVRALAGFGVLTLDAHALLPPQTARSISGELLRLLHLGTGLGPNTG